MRSRILMLTAVAAGCAGEPTGLPAPPAPVVESVAIARASSVLAAVVIARVQEADSVLVQFGAAGSALDSATPAVATGTGPITLPVLGLLPETDYRLRLVAFGADGIAASDTLHFATGALPDDLPRFQAGGTAPSPGYVLFSTGAYGVVIDNGGRVVWYLRFPDGPSLNFQAQPNGRYVARPPGPYGGNTGPLVEFDVLGRPTRALDCAGGLRARFHDALVEPDGGYWILCDETREMDLSGIAGVANAAVTGTVVQHFDAAGRLRFQWSAFDHFELTDLAEAERSGPTVNWTHGNALDLDVEGNLYLSFRSLSEVTKVDPRSGEVLWRMGGLRNEFAFPGGGVPFLRQHGVRVTPEGGVVLLDNHGELETSRGERYVVDAVTHTASLAGIYAPTPATRANLGGTTQLLPGGGVLVAYGDGGRLEEYDAGGARVWEVVGDAGYVFRAQRIRSLYHPEAGLGR
ncbi:MAG TPA: arylsulfotransferase family protein [Gemmatimonadales bacterium]|nr:arylsulfotransferase family protein [Gemmatimonadales bacterium]